MSVASLSMLTAMADVVGGLANVQSSAAAFRRSSSVETRDESGSESGGAMSSHDEETAMCGERSSASSKSADGDDHYNGSSSSRQRHHGRHGDPEKRMRREIANSNERRRMQSINAGFLSLKNLVRPRNGDKLSKAAILQHAVDYIADLHRQKNDLVARNARLLELLSASGGAAAAAASFAAADHPTTSGGSSSSRRRCFNSDDPTAAAAAPVQLPPKRRRPAETSPDRSRPTHRGRSSTIDAGDVGAASAVLGDVRRMTSVDELAVYRDVCQPGFKYEYDVKDNVSAGGASSLSQFDSLAADLIAAANATKQKQAMKSDADTAAVQRPVLLPLTVDTTPIQATMVDTTAMLSRVDVKPELQYIPPSASTSAVAAAAAAALGVPGVPWNIAGYYTWATPSAAGPTTLSAPTSSVGPESFWASTSKRNLDTILEAIRHLEGDQQVTPAVEDVDGEEVVGASDAEDDDLRSRRRNSAVQNFASVATPVKSCV